MKQGGRGSFTFRRRAIGAVTLHAFTFTTIAPNLAWAADRTEPTQRAASAITAHGSPPAVSEVSAERATDELAADDLAASRRKAKLPADRESANADAKVRPSKADLQDALGSNGSAPPDETSVEAEVAATDQALALPTGGDKSGVTSQAISTPKGEGTIQGMGESFSAQLSSGIATFSVPFALPGARGGAQPSLGLSYSSASGSGLAGMGWSVGVPYIARQTDRGLPQYDDQADWHPNQDRFVFSGGQELVPICLVGSSGSCNGKLADESFPTWATGYQYFRPRVEGSFLRFFWSSDHRTWRVQNKSGVTMELGVPLDGGTDAAHARGIETDPTRPSRIFRWHLARQYDPYCAGSVNCDTMSAPKPLNVVVYKYFQDGGQAYLGDIYDTTPATPLANAWDTSNLELLAHHTHLTYEPRPDPTETYHSGWLIRQTQRLVGVDVTSKPASGSAAARRQVRRYHLSYDTAYHTSYLTSVQLEGRCAGSETDASVPLESDGLLGLTNCERLPPMAFGYSHTAGYSTSGARNSSRLAGYEEIDARLQQVGGSPPHSVDEELTDYFDINSDGLPDILVTAPGTYGNDYGVFFNSDRGIRDTFGSVAQMGVSGVLGANSNTLKLSNANVSPLDADGDGIIDLLHMPQVKTYGVYHPKLVGGKWMLVGESVAAANQLNPKLDLGKDAAETRVLDVNFDGLVDVVVSRGTDFATFFALGRLPNGHMQFGHGNWAGNHTSNLSNDPTTRCVPYSGSPVRFSDADIQLGDMNGDGIQDLVRVRRGDLRYWPGRGNGFWGTGELDDCPAGTFGDKRSVTMDTSPLYVDLQGTSLRLDDINGDGLDDLIQVRFDAVDVYLNVDGHGWTERFIIEKTPASQSFANRVRLVDLNGSGTRDIAWGDGKKYQYMDLAGGAQPGLLTHVENGLGKSTDIEFSTSTAEMLAGERTGVPCSGDTGPFESAWCIKSPTVTHVVKRIRESDNLAILGVPASVYTIEYAYRDPLYEGRQREFRGFKRARSKRIGDSNSPSDFTESTFLLGECEDETPGNGIDECSLQERWRDNPRESLKGLPVVTERYDEQGRYLSTQSTTYRLRQLYAGRDGRAVRHAFQVHQRTTSYDTSAPTTLAALVDQTASQAAGVQLETAVPNTAADTSFSRLSCDLSAFPAEPSPKSESVKISPVPLRAAAGFATLESVAYVDGFGNQLAGFARGCIAGDACPVAQPGNVTDEMLCSFTHPKQISSWGYRTDLSWASGSADAAKRRKTLTTFNGFGAPTGSKATLQGSAPLLRWHATAGRAVAPTPATASVNSPTDDPTIDLGSKIYDDFGNVTEQTAPGGRCSTVTYDVATYNQLPIRENLFTGTCKTGTSLSTVASYDRSFGHATVIEDMTHQLTRTKYDGFGRLLELRRPRPDGTLVTDANRPAVRISYDLPPAGSGRAYSIIHTETQDGAQVADAQYLHSYSYVDGMGRPRLGLSEADPDVDRAPWVVSSIAEFDAKGAVRRKYLPFYLAQNPVGFPLANARPATQYGRQRYDAFGRQLQTFDVDGTVTLQRRYHALSTDLYDAADIAPGPHAGTYATTRNDGHGRTIATTDRLHVNGAVERREVRTQYLSTGEPSIITRVRADSVSAPVVRWVLYDTLGRMVVNADPHATVSFNPLPSSYTHSLKTWRYVYDDAGSLVGTSDARGCGQNFVYDKVGRLIAEDYSPCTSLHALYSAPNFSTSDGIEVLYQYDSAPASFPPGVGLPPGYGSNTGQFSPSSPLLLGRLVAVHDRAATTWFKYDGRGRVVQTNRRIAKNLANLTMATRYRPRWYTQDVAFDAADRPVSESTGATQLLGKANQSLVTTSYTKRGTVKKVGSSYGDLVSKIDRDAEGKVIEVAYGDKARTTTHSDFDSRRRLRSVQTYRGPPALWSQAPAAYSPAPAPDPAPPSTFQLTLEDLDYSYDIVGNPIEIRDWRDPRDWPSGSEPVSRRMEYDDLNRLTRVDYSYPAGTDGAVSPYAAEIAGQIDDRRPPLVGYKQLATRPAWQTYAYDWLGNTTRTDDDLHAFYDRSLGTVTQGTAAKPYQITGASQAASTGPHSGSLTAVTYDQAGNLLTLKVNRTAANCDAPGKCTLHSMHYDWDEVGRLAQANHLEGASGTNPTFQYVYDYSDQRVIRDDATTASRKQTLYVFGSLEIRGTQLTPDATEEYLLAPDNEVPYLAAHGMRLGRVVKEPDAAAAGFKGEPQLSLAADIAPSLHVFLELPDHMGSTSLVVDLATSELVEARTYQPYGATESDYRPDRWKGFREDYGFTGKEEDVEVGLQYFGKRYLSPYLGRWISADPLAVHSPGSADLNLYAYVSGAVLKAVDPVGLQSTNDPDQSAEDIGAYNEDETEFYYANGVKYCETENDEGGTDKHFQFPADKLFASGKVRLTPPNPAPRKQAVEAASDDELFSASMDGFKLAALDFGTLGYRHWAIPTRVPEPFPETFKEWQLRQSSDFGYSGFNTLATLGGGVSGGAKSLGADLLESLRGGGAVGYGSKLTLSGHGARTLGSVTVPEGGSVTIAGDGTALADDLGGLIEQGRWGDIPAKRLGELEGTATWLPGARIPNYTLTPPVNPTLNIRLAPAGTDQVILFRGAMKLSDAVAPGRDVVWSACTVPF